MLEWTLVIGFILIVAWVFWIMIRKDNKEWDKSHHKYSDRVAENRQKIGRLQSLNEEYLTIIKQKIADSNQPVIKVVTDYRIREIEPLLIEQQDKLVAADKRWAKAVDADNNLMELMYASYDFIDIAKKLDTVGDELHDIDYQVDSLLNYFHGIELDRQAQVKK